MRRERGTGGCIAPSLMDPEFTLVLPPPPPPPPSSSSLLPPPSHPPPPHSFRRRRTDEEDDEERGGASSAPGSSWGTLWGAWSVQGRLQAPGQHQGAPGDAWKRLGTPWERLATPGCAWELLGVPPSGRVRMRVPHTLRGPIGSSTEGPCGRVRMAASGHVGTPLTRFVAT